MVSKLRDRSDWFDLWVEDKRSMLDTMARNLASDLNDGGYDFFGDCIQRQMSEISAYKEQFDTEMDSFKSMTEEAVNRWCFYDMKKRGAIL